LQSYILVSFVEYEFQYKLSSWISGLLSIISISVNAWTDASFHLVEMIGLDFDEHFSAYFQAGFDWTHSWKAENIE